MESLAMAMMTTRHTMRALLTAVLWLCAPVAAAVLLWPAAAIAGDSYGSGYSTSMYGSTGSYNGGYGGYRNNESYHDSYRGGGGGSSGGRTYSAYYRTGDSGYGWLNFRSGEDTSTGYTGANTFIESPHRGDWIAKLQAQRQWDEKQYRKMQTARGAECGFTGAPAYCYRLMGPYPTEFKVVRY